MSNEGQPHRHRMSDRLADPTTALALDATGPFAPERRDLLPDWRRLLANEMDEWEAAKAAATGPRILVPTLVGGLAHAGVVESVLAVALTLRGARVAFVLCDGALDACQLALHDTTIPSERLAAGEIDKALCGACVAVGSRVLSGLGLPVHYLSEYLTPAERAAADAEAASIPVDRIPTYEPDGLPLGEHAVAGALRFFATGTLASEPHAERVLQRYLASTRSVERGVSRLIDRHRVDRAVFHHGIYVPQGVVRSVLARAGVPLATWNPGYRRGCFLFSHGDTYHHTMLEEPAEVWNRLRLCRDDQAVLRSYLTSRMDGSRDWIWFHDEPDSRLEGFAARTGVDLSRPMIGAFTNVMWDARLHFRSSAFDDQVTWLAETVSWASTRPDLQLVIRAHPAEIRGTVKSRQLILDALRARLGGVPENVIMIPPADPISTYALAARCDTVLVFGTKAAMEFAAAGLDVVTVGDAWTRGKRISRDPSDRQAYRRLLQTLPDRPSDPIRVERARRYAHHVFLRRMIPLRAFVPTGDDPPLRVAIDGLDSLRRGADPGLDVVCEGIMDGRPFIFDPSSNGSGDGWVDML